MESLSLVELVAKFLDKQSAIEWREELRWPDGRRCCLRCGSMHAVQDVPCTKPMPYRCGDCKNYFSLQTGTVM